MAEQKRNQQLKLRIGGKGGRKNIKNVFNSGVLNDFINLNQGRECDQLCQMLLSGEMENCPLELILWMEKEVAPHSSILVWEIPWTEEPGRLQSTGSEESGTTERLIFALEGLGGWCTQRGQGSLVPSPGPRPLRLFHSAVLELYPL